MSWAGLSMHAGIEVYMYVYDLRLYLVIRASEFACQSILHPVIIIITTLSLTPVM